MRKLMIGLVVVFSGCGTLHEQYVKQDRNNYETLAPRVRKLMADSTFYGEEQEGDIEDRLKAWDLWTLEGLEALKKKETE